MGNKLLESANCKLQQGEYLAAKEIYEQLIEHEQNNPKIYHGLSITALKTHDLSGALDYIHQAIALNASDPTFHNTLGNIFIEQKQSLKARNAFIKAVNLNPRNVDFRFNLANCYFMEKNYNLAIEHFEQVLKLNSNHYASLRDLTFSYICVDSPENAYNLALTWNSFYPNSYEALYVKGLTLHLLNKIPEAICSFEQSLNIRQDYDEALTALGMCHKINGNLKMAQQYIKKSLEINSDNPKTLYCLATIYIQLGQPILAKELFISALNIDPEYIDPICGLGCLELLKHKDEKALSFFEQAMNLDPLNAEAKVLAATTLLKQEKFESGWKLLTKRVDSYNFKAAIPPKNLNYYQPWDGFPLEKGELLVWGEQGIGDQICFVNLINDIYQYVPKVIGLCDQKLLSLFTRSLPMCEWISDYKQLEQFNITHHIGMLDIAQFCRQSHEDFPNHVGYLVPDKNKVEYFKKKYEKAFPKKTLIGISWKTSNAESGYLRNIDLAHWSTLLEKKFVQFINLQYGNIEQDLCSINSKLYNSIFIDTEVDPLNNLDDFAAQMCSLDLVISIDNSTVHFAGALGVPVFNLLSINSDWKWFKDYPYSFWYPSMNIFRQQKQGNWDEVFTQINKTVELHN